MKLFYNLTLTLIILSPIKIIAADYYWVGGTGNYSDTLHWATTSGGTIFHSVMPTEFDNVYFDVNSFTTSDDTVKLDIPFSCNAQNFIIDNVLNVPTFFGDSFELFVYGNFQLDSAINWQVTSDLWLYSNSSVTIKTENVYLNQIVHFIGNGSAMTYTLLDDLNCDYLVLDNGLATLGHNISCHYIDFNTTNPLYLENSTITFNTANFWLDGGIINPPFFCDSAIFLVSSLMTVGPGDSIHFGTIKSDSGLSIVSDKCTFNSVSSSGYINYITGEGNFFKDVFGNFQIEIPYLSTISNHISNIETDNLSTISNIIIDTLVFPNPGGRLLILDTLTITGKWVMNDNPSTRGYVAEWAGTGYIRAVSGIFCFDFIDIQDIDAIGGAQFFAGYNSTNSFQNSGWQMTGCTSPGGVWPGDANYDLVVNNMDILALGTAMNATGPVRAGASLVWIEQTATAWSDTFPTGVNLKHADCNGDGVVDATDTLAVSQNYSFTHPASRIKPIEQTATNFSLTLDVTPDSVGPLSPIHVNVDLSIDSIYGIAFSIKYDPELIDPATLLPDFSNSWLGTQGVDMIVFSKVLSSAGQIDFALTRTDHTDAIGGVGHLLSFDIATSANVVEGTTLNIYADNVSGMYLSGAYEPIAGASDSSYVDSSLGITNHSQEIKNLIAYLNNDLLQLNFYVANASDYQLELYDVTGRIIFQKEIFAQSGTNKKQISVGELSHGIFFLMLEGNNQREVLKIVNQ